MKLSGMLSKVMDNFLCLRGIASIKVLANISEVNPDIQRDLLEEHKNEMKDFLERGEYAFFPEVVLSMDFGLLDTTDDGKIFEDFVAVVDSADEGLRKRDIGKIKINFTSDNNKFIDDRRQLKIAQIEFDESILKLSRIDGNHRLSCAEYLTNDILIPFCIVIFPNEREARNNSRAIFHNINSKQIPLRLEQNLRIIIENSDVYPNSILENPQPFGSHYKHTRELLCGDRKVDFDCFPLIKSFLSDNKYSFFTDLFRYLLKEELIQDATAVVKVKNELVNVENTLREAGIISSSQNSAIIGALAYYKLSDPDKYSRFIKWIARNHIADVNSVSIDDTISIFDKVYESIPRKVFLARWYPAETHEEYSRAQRRRNEIGKVIEKDLGLRLIDLGTQDGATYDIRSAINKEIRASDIFIADLTGCRPNVMAEVGYALNCNKLAFDHLNPCEWRILFYFSKTSDHPNPPFDLSGFRYEMIDEAAEIAEKIKPLIESILAEMT